MWIGETVAKYFPGENPVGKRIVHGAFDSKEPPFTVAGVVNDVKDGSLATRRTERCISCSIEYPQSWMGLAIKASIPFEQVMPAVRREVAAFDKDLPLADESTLEQAIGESMGRERFTMFVLGIFAAVALLLAAVGVYGVIAYFVAQLARDRHSHGARRTADEYRVAGDRAGARDDGIRRRRGFGCRRRGQRLDDETFIRRQADGHDDVRERSDRADCRGVRGCRGTDATRHSRVNPANTMRAD